MVQEGQEVQADQVGQVDHLCQEDQQDPEKKKDELDHMVMTGGSLNTWPMCNMTESHDGL